MRKREEEVNFSMVTWVGKILQCADALSDSPTDGHAVLSPHPHHIGTFLEAAPGLDVAAATIA